MSFTVSIHPGDNPTVGDVSDLKCFYITIENGGVLMIWGSQIRWFRDQLNKRYPVEDDPKPCEFCDSPSTTTEQDELGNDCRVCEDHAQTLAASKPERRSDELYDEQKDEGQ